MIASLLLALLVTLSGTVASYLYDEDASLGARLCSGGALGLAGLGLINFIVASLIGLTSSSVVFSAAICCSPLALLSDAAIRKRVSQDLDEVSAGVRLLLRPDLKALGYFIFYCFVALVLWLVFSRAVIEDQTGLSTGLLNNFGDLPFHLSVITSFVFGNNFPPEDPTYAGVRFTYPFISDFVSAIFVRCGADLRQSMFIENYILALSFVGLLHRWALVLVRDKLAAILTPLIVLLNGGLGWMKLFDNASSNQNGLFGVLMDLPPSFTVIPETTWRWGNAISALLVPQRGFLMGLPLATIAFTQWWLATDKTRRTEEESRKAKKSQVSKTPKALTEPIWVLSASAKSRRMIAAGVAAGLLPLVHAHSFVVVMAMAACLALLLIGWREWFTFFVVASVIAIPQLLWSTLHSSVQAGSFFAWEVGWDHGQENPIIFWLQNTGFFIPVLMAAILTRGDGFLVSKRLLLFYLPFTLCFIIPNLTKMAPWIWDNIKVLYYWWLASSPLVALLLARLWRQSHIRQVIAVLLFVCITLSGALDVAGIALRETKYQVFDAAGMEFAEIVKQQTAPRALIVHAPVHNTPVFLTGRRSLMGYPGHIWTHGLEFSQRERETKRIYTGAPDADQLIRTYGIQYLVVGPHEMREPVNELYFTRFQKVGEVGGYTLYKVRN